MGRKIACLLVLFIFMVFLYSCYSTIEKNVATVAGWKARGEGDLKKLAIFKRNGDVIRLNKKDAGRIVKSGIEIRRFGKTDPEFIPFSEIEKIRFRQYDTVGSILGLIFGVAPILGMVFFAFLLDHIWHGD
jgi:hypothetical protein